MTKDPRTMYHVAAQFLMAAHRCIRKEPFGGRPAESLDVPGIVNVAFAAEVLFKGLLSMEGLLPERAGHLLANLFEQLPERHRAHIRDRVEQEFDQFDERLRSVSDCFREWRYVYEVESLTLHNNRFLHKLTHTTADHLLASLRIDPKDQVTLVRPVP